MDSKSLSESPLFRNFNAASTPPATSQGAYHNRQASPGPVPSSRSQNDTPDCFRSVRDGNVERSIADSPFRLQMPFVTPGQLAFSALQFLPVPVLVLNSLKTVVLANEAMGRLLGLVSESETSSEEAASTLEQLHGQSLSQVGIDMAQDGCPVWVAWDTFLDSIVDDISGGQTSDVLGKRKSFHNYHDNGDMTPTADVSEDKKSSPPPQQTVIEVVVTRSDLHKSILKPRLTTKKTSEHQMYAKMIISVWEIADHQTYFTLTFTNTESTPQVGRNRRAVARPGALESAEKKTPIIASNPPSVSSSHGSASSPSYRISPHSVSVSSSPFPPLGPPFKSMQSAPSVLQKMMIIKDALLDNTETPIIGMWKDCTIAYPNAACRRLMSKDAAVDNASEGIDIINNWVLYSEDFSRVLEPREYPIAVLLNTQTPFSGVRIGIVDPDGKKLVYDILAEAIRDEDTDEFLAGVVTCRDVTKMAKEIDQIKTRDAERFKTICDIIPQLVWTADTEGSLDFFNTRWTDFTGLTAEESVGLYNWVKALHPDDVATTRKRWQHSLRTGEPYSVEYRLRNKEGEWQWMLGRAMPLRNPDTGKIDNWFGTCTDVHESIETKLAARRTRQQLLSVIAHAHVTIFTVDTNRKLTMLEGALIENEGLRSVSQDGRNTWCVGGNVDEVFNQLQPDLPHGQKPDFLSAIDAIIARKASDMVVEHSMSEL